MSILSHRLAVKKKAAVLRKVNAYNLRKRSKSIHAGYGGVRALLMQNFAEGSIYDLPQRLRRMPAHAFALHYITSIDPHEMEVWRYSSVELAMKLVIGKYPTHAMKKPTVPVQLRKEVLKMVEGFKKEQHDHICRTETRNSYLNMAFAHREYVANEQAMKAFLQRSDEDVLLHAPTIVGMINEQIEQTNISLLCKIDPKLLRKKNIEARLETNLHMPGCVFVQVGRLLVMQPHETRTALFNAFADVWHAYNVWARTHYTRPGRTTTAEFVIVLEKYISLIRNLKS